MAVDEHARHRLHQKLEEVLGPQEAGILMDHLPPRGFGDLATKGDLELLGTALKADIDGLRAGNDAEHASLRADMARLEERLTAQMERMSRRVVQWTSSTVLVGIGLAIAAGRLV